MATWKLRAVLLLASALIALLIVELGLRVAMPRAAWLSPDDEAYWLALERTESEGRSVERDVVLDPELGWRMRPGYRSPDVTHDSRGFRHTPQRNPDGPRRIVLIGDSFTYGLGVADDETVATHLAERMPDRAVLNAGVNGYGVGQARLLWERELASEGAEFVVLGYFVDDFNRNVLRVREFPKPRYALAGSELVVTGVPVPTLDALLGAQGWGRLRLFDAAGFVGDRARRRLGLEPPGFQDKARLSDRLLASLASSVSTAGGRLLVVVLPSCGEPSDAQRSIEAQVEASCERLGIPVLPMRPVFSRYPDPESLCNEHWHLSATGNAVVAEELERALARLDAASAPSSVPAQATPRDESSRFHSLWRFWRARIQ